MILRTALLRSLIAVSVGLATPALVHAQDAPASTQTPSATQALHTRVTWNGHAYDVKLLQKKKERAVEILDRRGRRTAYERIPTTALSSLRNPRLSSTERSVKGQASILEVRITGDNFSGTTTAYHMVFVRPENNPRLIWAGRQSSSGTGERFRIEDLDESGKEQLVTYAQSPTVNFCGKEEAPLFPRVWNERTQEFDLISKPVSLPSDTPQLTAESHTPPHHWAVGTQWRGVSSDAGHRVIRSYGRAPARLWDNDPRTEWRAQGPNAGTGNFVTAHINAYANLAGIAYTLPEDPAFHPQTLAIHTESSHYIVELPAGQITGYIALPAIESTACVTLSILEARPRAQGVGFAELHVYTALDVGDPDTVFETHILTPYREAQTRIEHEAIAQLMTLDDPRLARGAVQLLQELGRDAQVPIIDALMSTEHGRKELYKALQKTELSSAAIAALGRALRGTPDENVDALFEILDHTTQRNIEHSIIRILSRSLTAKDAPRLLPYLKNAPSTWRGDFVFGLAKISKRDIDVLLHALSGSLVADPILLRASMRIARRDHAIAYTPDPQSVQNLERALDHDNGTIARLAYELVGWLHIESLQDRLLFAFENDPQSTIRLAAFRGLVHDANTQEHADTSETLLLRAMRSDDPSMRIEAARQFRTRTLSEREIDTLLDALRTERWPEAMRPLLTALIRQKDDVTDEKVASLLLKKERSLLRTALVAWQSRSTPVRLDILLSLYDEARTSDSLLSNWIHAVANISTDEAAATLRDLYDTSTPTLRVQAEILEALGRQRIDSNIRVLQSNLTHPDASELRRAAARGLAWYTKHPDVKADLQRARTNEEDPAAKRAIEHALKAIESSERARELLLRESPQSSAPDPQNVVNTP